MSAIYTEEWYEDLKRIVNSDPTVTKRAPQGTWRLMVHTEGDGVSPYFKKGERLNYFITFHDGKCTDYKRIKEGDEEPGDLDFRVRGDATIFERVAAELDDPIKIALKGDVNIKGDMRLLLLHADLVKRILEIYSNEMETEWTKGKPPY